MEAAAADPAAQVGSAQVGSAKAGTAAGGTNVHLILIDGSGFIFRAFHALPPMTRPDGTPVNAVFGFTNMLAKLLKDHVGTHFAVIFDAGRLTFRNELYDQYKAHRPEPPSELVPQFALVREATLAFGVPSIELAGWEADDLIASYARHVCAIGGRTTIVSSDKDLMQLLRPGVDMLDPIKQKPIGPAEVMEKFGVAPEKLVEVQALMGDSVDNVPGVPGIGPKNAAQLINEFGDLEAVLRAAPAMKPSKRRENLITFADAARVSRQLVLLRDDAPLPAAIDDLAVRAFDPDRLGNFLLAQGFRSTQQRLGLDAPGAFAPSAVPPSFGASPGGAPLSGGTPSSGAAPSPAGNEGAAPAVARRGQAAAAFGPYVTVTTPDTLHAWVAEATAAGTVAVQVAADGPDPLRAGLIGIALATQPGRACYVPLRHVDPSAAPPAQPDLLPAAPPADLSDEPAGLAADDGEPPIAPGLLPEPELLPEPGLLSEPGLLPEPGFSPDPQLSFAPEPAPALPAAPALPDAPGAPAGIEQIPLADALAALAPLLRDPAVMKVFVDAKFAVMVLTRANAFAAAADAPGDGAAPAALPVAPLDDVQLISYAQEAGAHGHGIDELAALHLGHSPATLDSVTGTGRNRLALGRVPVERAAAFAGEAADVTLRLWHALRPKLRETRALALYELIERRLVDVLSDMERAGVKVDAADLRAMSIDFARRMAVIETDIHRLAGETFNLGSPKQLGEILFDRMGLPGGRRMKTGAWGTDVNVLQALAEQGYELPGRILEWRQLAKLKSTYADSLVEDIHPDTGRVHTSFAMAITSTGRLSSNDPNLQNIPIRTEEGSRIRHAFVAEPGHTLVSADYSQIELRLLAHVADLPQLRESFRNGEDIHARTASEVFGVPMERMDAMTRRRAKAINFGIIYGISAFGLGRQLQIPPGEARTYIDAYFARYPGIRHFMEKTKDDARIAGYVVTPFGRRCYIPGIADRNPARRAYAERQATNAPLQGGAADIIKRAMVRLPRALRDAGLSARLLLQVHDELLFEAPDAEAARTAEVARAVMEAAATLSVPLVVETGHGRTWADAH